METSSKIAKSLTHVPEKLLSKIQLVYVDDGKLSISRKKTGKNFAYFYKKGKLTEESHLNRINELVIPPAWANVRITHLPNGHLQAVGRDNKNRKQYRYHSQWSKIRNETKFYRMSDFGQKLPALRKRIEENMNCEGWPKKKVIALVIALMDETHMRIGNDHYAKINNTYGLTTLRKKHLDDDYNKLRFLYTGKRGKKHRVTLKSKKLIRLVRQCEELPGWELFQFYDKDGNKQSIDSGMVNTFLQENFDADCSAKDFRTWAASVIFFETLCQFQATEDITRREKNLLDAYDSAAKALGNTRNVCRKYYVHPHISATYLKEGTLPQPQFKNKSSYFSTSERQLMALIREYEPKIATKD